MEIEGFAFQLLLRVMMRKGMSWIGLYKDHTVSFGREMDGGGGSCKEDPGQQPGKDVVLDHIILDLTGKSVPIDQIADPSTQRAFKRKKRLLRHSNTVLMSRLGIMALAAIMLMVTTLLTWYFTSTYSARSIRTLATDLRQQLMSNSMQAMISVLGEVYNATFVLSSLQQQVYYGSSNQSWDSVELELRRVNRGVFNAQHQYTSVAFVSEDGRVTDFTRSQTSCEYFFFVNTTYAEAETPLWYWQNFTGYFDELQAPPATVAPGPFPLSASNVLSKRPMEVYWTIAANIWNEAVVSPAVPARDMTTDNLLGMATITSTFTYLNSYLATIDLLGGILYFEWQSEARGSSLVAFSYNSTADTLLSPLNASNPIVRAAALFLQSRYGNTVMSVDETHSADIDLVGQSYYIDTAPLSQPPYSDLNLTAVLIVPRKSIMGRIDQRNHAVVRVSIGTAIGVLVLGCCFICFITSKMSTEMQLRQELIRLLLGKHRAEQSSNYKSQFMANMSHELRTPIAAIIGLLDVLSSDFLTPDQEINVSQIRSCATGLLGLVHNVLDITKVEAGSMELEVAPFSVTEELEALVDMFAVQSAGSNIEVVLDLSDDIPPVVRGDAPRIRQIFKNLLSNSVKFTTKGHVLVKGWVDQSLLFKQNGKQTDFVRSMSGMLSRRERVSDPLMMGIENQVALVFEVHDTGCGIPADLYESVFDSFVQADSSTTRTYGGSGLGLYVVRSLVELMGGEVAVIPTEGPGTLMRFHVIVEKADNNSFIGGRMSCGDVHNQSFGSSAPDWLNSVIESPPTNPLELLSNSPPSPPEVPHEKPQVLVAMLEGVALNVAVQWLEKDGLNAISVKVWDDILPVLEELLKTNNAAELRSPEAVGNDVSGVGIDPGISQNRVNNTESSPSSVLGTPSVLALVDVTMHPSTKMGFDPIFVEPTVLGLSDMTSNGPDPERLPPHMQDILDCMLRIHGQNPVAVGWIVGPDCGLGWRQALEAGGRFSVMKKPLSGNRMRQLIAHLTSSEKLEQHCWEDVQSSSSSTSTPSLRSMPMRDSHEGNFVSHRKDRREYSEPNVGVLRDRGPVYTAPASAHHLSEKLIEDTDPQASFLNCQRHSQETPSGRESNGEVFSSETSSAEFSEDFRKVGVDDRDSRFVGAHSSDVKPSTKSPSNGFRTPERVLLLDVPYDTDESQMPFGLSNNPLSPTNGLVAPEVAANGVMNKSEREDSLTANGVQEMQSIRMDGRDLEKGAMDLRFLDKAQENHSVVSKGLSIHVESGHTSHEKTSATSPVIATPGQLPALSDTKTSNQFSHKNHVPSIPDTTGKSASNSAKAFKNRALSSMNILLVEDTPVLQRLASMMLKKLGANVTVVGDGQQAVTAVSETVKATEHIDAPYLVSGSHFDLILMDCAMPVMDGYHATLAIRAAEENTSRHIPIVALTAHALASDEERCLSVGMDAYLTKPINCQLMVTTIQDLVSKQRA